MHFQNVSECVVARGILGFEKHSLTLTEPVFLFDTMRSTSRTPAYYSQTFCCRKLKAVRPVPKMCEECAGKHTTTGAPAEDQGPEDGGTVATSESGSSLSGVGNESSGMYMVIYLGDRLLRLVNIVLTLWVWVIW